MRKKIITLAAALVVAAGGFAASGESLPSLSGTTTSCTGTGAVASHILSVVGTVATATVTITGGCVKVGLASYQAANGQPFPGNLPQTLFDSTVGVFGPGIWTLKVNVPDCFAQTDLFVGDVIENLSASNAYGSRLLPPAIPSGKTSCAPVTTTTTPTTSTTTPGTTTAPTTTTPTPSVSTSTETVTETVTAPPPPPTTVTLPAVTTRGADHTVTVTKKSVVTKTRIVTKTKPCPKPKRATCPKGAHPVKDKHGKWHCAFEANG